MTLTETGCWEWQGGRSVDGYGQLSLARVQILAHRLAYEVWKGPVEEGFHVLHTCDNPPLLQP